MSRTGKDKRRVRARRLTEGQRKAQQQLHSIGAVREWAPLEHRVCSEAGKQSYVSARQAKLAHASSAARLRVYRCSSCGEWHVTSRDKEDSSRPPAPRDLKQLTLEGGEVRNPPPSPRACCPECGKSVLVTKARLLASHSNGWQQRCPGSGMAR